MSPLVTLKAVERWVKGIRETAADFQHDSYGSDVIDTAYVFINAPPGFTKGNLAPLIEPLTSCRKVCVTWQRWKRTGVGLHPAICFRNLFFVPLLIHFPFYRLLFSMGKKLPSLQAVIEIMAFTSLPLPGILSREWVWKRTC